MTKNSVVRWNNGTLLPLIDDSINQLRARKRLIRETSGWWCFIHHWFRERNNRFDAFMAGSYRFEPMSTYTMPDEAITVWSYADRLFVRGLLYLIKPVFKHVISPQCLHLKGPSGVKQALDLTKKALGQNGRFRYFMRLDIKSYYASIDRKILFNQVTAYFKDPRVVGYLEQIIHIPTQKNGAIHTPRLGIPRRSSLSPFLGALYLSPLDRAFENAKGVYYLRFMDDVVALFETKRQFCNVKKRLQSILSSLKLKLSRHKTKMGPLTRGFHFLGINFKINADALASDLKEPVAQTQSSQSHVSIDLHERGCIRAMSKIAIMKEDDVHPSKVQSYLSKWSTWWRKTASPIPQSDILTRFKQRAAIHQPDLCWLVNGLLWPLGHRCSHGNVRAA